MALSDTVNLDGHRLSIYDIDHIMQQAYDFMDREQVAITDPRTAEVVNDLVKPYLDTENRDPSTELAELRSIATRWGNLTIHIHPEIAPGTILFMNARDYGSWEESMKQEALSARQIINIGEN